MSSVCKSCGASIIWAETEKGKKVPLDAKPEKRYILVEHTRGISSVVLRNTYLTHFVTCPDSKSHRK
jgi:hypothetical protein